MFFIKPFLAARIRLIFTNFLLRHKVVQSLVKMASTESRAQDMFNNPNIKSIYRAASRVTGPYAKALVQQSGIAKALSAGNRELSILDQACGTGVVAEALCSELAAAGSPENNWRLKCTDNAQAMLDAMSDLVKEEGWRNVETAKSDILNNGLESDTFDYAFGSFGEWMSYNLWKYIYIMRLILISIYQFLWHCQILLLLWMVGIAIRKLAMSYCH